MIHEGNAGLEKTQRFKTKAFGLAALTVCGFLSDIQSLALLCSTKQALIEQ